LRAIASNQRGNRSRPGSSSHAAPRSSRIAGFSNFRLRLDRLVHSAHRINLTGHSLRRSRAVRAVKGWARPPSDAKNRQPTPSGYAHVRDNPANQAAEEIGDAIVIAMNATPPAVIRRDERIRVLKAAVNSDRMRPKRTRSGSIRPRSRSREIFRLRARPPRGAGHFSISSLPPRNFL
jgi:hypothetical protein